MRIFFSSLLFLLFLQTSFAAKSPIYSCPGPNVCILKTYEGLVFPDGTQQSTAAGATGGLTGIGTLDSAMTPSVNGAVISGVDLLMQSASATVPGLVNTTTQSFVGAKTFTNNISTASLLILPIQALATTPTCGTPQKGALAITNGNILCVCTGTGWVVSSSGVVACTF